jgi:hypothetical protein
MRKVESALAAKALRAKAKMERAETALSEDQLQFEGRAIFLDVV